MEEALQRLVSGSKQVTAELGYQVRRRQEPGIEPGALVSGMGKTRKAGVGEGKRQEEDEEVDTNKFLRTVDHLDQTVN